MSKQFYVKRSAKIQGPVGSNKLKKLASSGELKLSDEISESDSGPWHAVGSVSDLAQLLPTASRFEADIELPSQIAGESKPASRVKMLVAVLAMLAVIGISTGIGIALMPDTDQQEYSPVADKLHEEPSVPDEKVASRAGSDDRIEEVALRNDGGGTTEPAPNERDPGAAVGDTVSVPSQPTSRKTVDSQSEPTTPKAVLHVDSKDFADVIDEIDRFSGRRIQLTGGFLHGNVEKDDRAEDGAYSVLYENQRGDLFLATGKLWISMPRAMAKAYRQLATANVKFPIKTLNAVVQGSRFAAGGIVGGRCWFVTL